jgi:hypothetical protein
MRDVNQILGGKHDRRKPYERGDIQREFSPRPFNGKGKTTWKSYVCMVRYP